MTVCRSVQSQPEKERERETTRKKRADSALAIGEDQNTPKGHENLDDGRTTTNYIQQPAANSSSNLFLNYAELSTTKQKWVQKCVRCFFFCQVIFRLSGSKKYKELHRVRSLSADFRLKVYTIHSFYSFSIKSI